MNQRASIAALLHQLDGQSPAGFAIALHIHFTTATYLFQTYPKRWMDHYSKSGFVVHDPTVRWGLNNVGHVRWTELEPIDKRGVLEHAKDFGLMHGVAVAVVADGTRSIASFARADQEYDEAEMAELERHLAALHDATAGPSALSASDQAALTELSIRLSH